MTDSEFLNWLGDRLVHVYGESENVDFVLKVRRLAQAAAQQVSAEAKPLPVGWLPNLVDGELLVPIASTEAGKGVEREAYIADLIDTFEQLRQILGTPEQDADALIATVRRLAAFDSPQEAAEPTDEQWRASKYGQEAAKLADDYQALLTAHAALLETVTPSISAPQEASKPENTRFPMNVYLRNEDELWDFMMENLQELVAKRGIQLSRGR